MLRGVRWHGKRSHIFPIVTLVNDVRSGGFPPNSDEGLPQSTNKAKKDGAIEIASIQTMSAYADYKNLTHAGGFCLTRRGFNRRVL